MPNTSTTAFPAGLDVPLSEPSAVDRSDAAMLAVQTKIGTDGSTDPSSLDYRVSALESGASGVARMVHVRKTSNYSASVNQLVECNTTSSEFTVTLPSLATVSPGDTIAVQLFTGSNQVVVDGFGANTINGQANHALTKTKELYRYSAASDLSDWIIN